MMLLTPVFPHRCPDPPVRVRVPFPVGCGRWGHLRLEDRPVAFFFRHAAVRDILGKSAARGPVILARGGRL
jgi:hypothetical protein